MSGQTPTVFLVDDDPSVLKSLSRVLRSAGLAVAPFASPLEFLRRHDPGLPGCLVLDIAMPGLDGLELQSALATSGHERPIVFLTGRADVPMSVQAMKRGAVDFLTKPVHEAALLEAVTVALERDTAARRAGRQRAEVRRRWATLTPREREVLGHVITGRLNKQIAAALGTAEKTVKVHRGRVMAKMQARSVAELVRLTERSGIPPR
ncbi:MAG: response regulator transcription factor [Gemmatimonadales bacterium]